MNFPVSKVHIFENERHKDENNDAKNYRFHSENYIQKFLTYSKKVAFLTNSFKYNVQCSSTNGTTSIR